MRGSQMIADLCCNLQRHGSGALERIAHTKVP